MRSDSNTARRCGRRESADGSSTFSAAAWLRAQLEALAPDAADPAHDRVPEPEQRASCLRSASRGFLATTASNASATPSWRAVQGGRRPTDRTHRRCPRAPGADGGSVPCGESSQVSRYSPRATSTAAPPTTTCSIRSAEPSARARRIDGRPISTPWEISISAPNRSIRAAPGAPPAARRQTRSRDPRRRRAPVRTSRAPRDRRPPAKHLTPTRPSPPSAPRSGASAATSSSPASRHVHELGPLV